MDRSSLLQQLGFDPRFIREIEEDKDLEGFGQLTVDEQDEFDKYIDTTELNYYNIRQSSTSSCSCSI